MASKADDVTAPRRAAEWVTHRERGSMTMLRIMTFLSLRLGRAGGRIFLHWIAAYFFAFAPTARRHARAYLRKVLGREPTAADRYRHVLTFPTTIHDRVFLLKERFDLFDITLDGEPESYATAHNLLEIEDSCKKVLALIARSTTLVSGAEVEEFASGIREELRHIHYHVLDDAYLNVIA